MNLLLWGRNFTASFIAVCYKKFINYKGVCNFYLIFLFVDDRDLKTKEKEKKHLIKNG